MIFEKTYLFILNEISPENVLLYFQLLAIFLVESGH